MTLPPASVTSNIPAAVSQAQPELPERLEAAAGDRAEIKRRRTVASHAVRPQREFPVVTHVDTIAPMLGREAGANQAFRELLHG